MHNHKAAHIIEALRKKWIERSILSDLFFSAGLAVLFSIILNKLFPIPIWSASITFLFIFSLLVFIHTYWKITNTNIAELLNQEYPELQESSGLLLKEENSLNLLERLQTQHTETVLSGMINPLRTDKKLKRSLLALLVMTGMAMFIYQLPLRSRPDTQTETGFKDHVTPKTERRLPQISQVRLLIEPPRYTAKKMREQNMLNVVVEQGSSVSWHISTNLAVPSMKFIFNDSLQQQLRPTDSTHRQWTLDRKFFFPGFYQVDIDGTRSELYKIETIVDQLPVIHVQTPEQYTTIDFGQPQKVTTRIAITDDYGLTDASIAATISSGSGEAVKFKEQKIALPGFVAGKLQYELQKILSLPDLGMHPGDELYFFIRAKDNYGQEARSDIYIINLPDTADLMNAEGLANSITLKPAYFRSQRQIIIETEQLLKDKDTISIEDFKNRSNNLGIDQKMLRLRYGRFLGEEDETGEVAGGKDRIELQDPANFSNAEKLKEAFTDQHDKAEDATFFEPELKKQLKATLSEMWNAELPLRIFKPQEALPFEYKALRLLKDLQQKTRAYVAKTNSKTTPLDLQKRLTGDLTKIDEQTRQTDVTHKDDPQNALRNALGMLEKLNANKIISDISAASFQDANILLNEKAIAQPALYLNAVEAFRSINNALNAGAPIAREDIIIVEKAFQNILSIPIKSPTAGSGGAKQELSNQYFINLQKRNHE